MNNLKQQNKDKNELNELTPFDLNTFKNPGNFGRGNLFVETQILESAKPLEPWSNKIVDKSNYKESS